MNRRIEFSTSADDLWIHLGSLGLLLVLAIAPLEAGPARHLDASSDNVAAGDLEAWDLTAADITFKRDLGEVWVLDAHSSRLPILRAFDVDDLTRPPVDHTVLLPLELIGAKALGVADIPHGSLRGSSFLLIDTTFDSREAPDPQIGIVDEQGTLTDFSLQPVFGVPEDARLTSIDVHPEREEIAVYDRTRRAVWILDFALEVVDGPLFHVGDPGFFVDRWTLDSPRGAGAGIAWSGCDTLLVVTGLDNEFHLSLAVEIDVTAGGDYAGRLVDLSRARSPTAPRPSFVSIDVADFEDGTSPFAPDFDASVLYALDFAGESLHAFELELEEHPPPVSIESLDINVATDSYHIEWSPLDERSAEAIHVIENGVEIAHLPPGASSFTSRHPLTGRTLVRIATSRRGVKSPLQPTLELDDSIGSDGGTSLFAQDARAPGFRMTGCTVTPLPASLDEFRAYLIGTESNDVRVYDHQLSLLETLELSPRVERDGDNLAAIGIALTELDGIPALAILDGDGPLGDNVPTVTLHSLGAGTSPGVQIGSPLEIDLTPLFPTPFLVDIDASPDGHFVACGLLPDDSFRLVFLAFDETRIEAVSQVPVPWSQLSSFDTPHPGIGVSVLPSGSLLVAGGDAFTSTPFDAALMTPFDARDATILPRFTGFVAALPNVTRRLDLGPGLGPATVFGYDTSHWPPASEDGEATTVHYLPTVTVDLVTHPATFETLEIEPNLFVSDGTVEVSGSAVLTHPDLATTVLLDEMVLVEPLETAVFELATPDLPAAESTDYSLHLINPSPNSPLIVELRFEDGEGIASDLGPLVIEPGRYHRSIANRRTRDITRLRLVNRLPLPAQTRMLIGARRIASEPGGRLELFRRGDCRVDGLVNVSDAIELLGTLFLGEFPICPDACDTDDSGEVTLTDAVFLLQHLFTGGRAPPSPGANRCGFDPSGDSLDACDTGPLLGCP